MGRSSIQGARAFTAIHDTACRCRTEGRTHLRRFLSMSVSGRHSLCLCGPGDGLGACNSGTLCQYSIQGGLKCLSKTAVLQLWRQ